MTLTEPTAPAAPAAEPRRRSVRPVAVVTTLVSLIALAVVTHVAISTPGGQRLDERAMRAVVADRDAQLTLLSLLGYVSIGAIAMLTVGCVVVALARGRLLLAAAAVGVVAGANVTTQVLKHVVLERADLVGGVVAPNSLPSGHTTVVAAGLGALCLVSPRWLRPVVVVAGSFAVTVTATSTVVAGWHRPSDVVAAMLVATGWTAAAAVVVGGHRTWSFSTPLGAGAGAIGGLALLVAIGMRPSYGWVGVADAGVVLGVVSASIALLTVAMAVSSPSSFPVKPTADQP